MAEDFDVSLLSPDDVLAGFRLIERLCEIGSSGSGWRDVVVAEIPKLIDADQGHCYLMKTTLDPGDIGLKTLAMRDYGANQFWRKFLAEGDLTIDPATAFIMQRFGTDFTVSRAEWIDDKTWRKSRFFKEVLIHAGWEHVIYSQVGIDPPGVVDGLGFSRRIGAKPFSPRDVAIVRFVHQELARLWRKNAAFDVNTLPIRQRQVLDGIRAGQSRKAIAKKLRLSEHTVHSHETALFARVEVSSRGELLAKLAGTSGPNLLP